MGVVLEDWRQVIAFFFLKGKEVFHKLSSGKITLGKILELTIKEMGWWTASKESNDSMFRRYIIKLTEFTYLQGY